MATSRVTVLIDTYNHERFIEQAIVSVLEQDFPASDTQILVIDDGSTDRTPAIVRKFEPSVRLIRKPNGGQASAFNVGIAEAGGEIIAFLDGDDWWAGQKLSFAIDAFDKYPDIAAVGHGYFEVHDDDPPAEMFVPEKTCRIDLSSPSAARVAALGRTLLGTSRLVVRRRVLDTVGPIPAALTFCADAPMLTLSLALGGALILDRPLCYYRQHSANLFAIDAGNLEKSRRRSEMLTLLLAYLPQRLTELGVSREVIAALLEEDRIELDRLRMQFGGGGRWKSFQIEMRDFKASYRNASPAYAVFKGLVGATALILSPHRFHQLRDWYGRKNMKRFRSKFANAESTVSPAIFQRKPVMRRD